MEISLEQIKALLPKRTTLIFLGRDDSLEGFPDLMQRCIAENSFCVVSEDWDDWYLEQEYSSVEGYLNDLKDSLKVSFGIEEEEAEMGVLHFQDELTVEIYERDDSNAFMELINRTGKVSMIYSTGEEFPECYREDLEESLSRMKKILQIEGTKFDRELKAVLENSGYGGELEIFFREEFHYFVNEDGKEFEWITFKNPMVGIIAHGCGAGYAEELKGHEMTFQFERANLFVEKTVKYNYTFDIAGMYYDWADDTEVSVGFGEKECNKVEVSEQADNQKREKELTEKFNKTGVCTALDMDITRHKGSDLEYINSFPCGTKCKACQTFWID